MVRLLAWTIYHHNRGLPRHDLPLVDTRRTARPCCIAARAEFGYMLPMPTVMRVGPYRLFFYSADGSEPPHIHVERDTHIAKFWLDPVRLASSGGYNRSELRQIDRIVADNVGTLLEAWNDHFGS
jgi:hypothetical protein